MSPVKVMRSVQMDMRRSVRPKKEEGTDEETGLSIESGVMVKKEQVDIKKKKSPGGKSATKVTMAEKIAVKKEKRKAVVKEEAGREKREVVLVKDELDEVEERKGVITIEDDDDDEDEVDEMSTTPGRRAINAHLMKYTYQAKTATTQPSPGIFSAPTPKRKREAKEEEEDQVVEVPIPTLTPTSTSTSISQAVTPTRITAVESPITSASQAIASTRITAVESPITPSPSKRRRERSGYAPPSTYAHLNLLQDAIGPSLICLFVGLNPGLKTASTGHAYSHPTNLFWRLLHSSGCTTRRCAPAEDQDLPRLFALGNTNIVARPTRNQAELSRAEMVTSVSILEEKVRTWRPEAVCLVGKGIWESVWQAQHGRKLKNADFRYGWQSESENIGRVPAGAKGGEWQGAKVFVATSTSGLAANTTPAEKEAIWRPLGEWVQRRRTERGM
ncbi:MAG: hypothetical protein M1816_006864 [Peltula sp. TS41687]|nr:MAG: hypothetical protein M1816_006864 [Peltula sp. TS41687]